VERRPCEVERALAGEDVYVERLDLAGRRAEQRHQPTRPYAVERLHEGVLANRIIDDGQQLAAGDVLDAGDEILARVDDRMMAAMGLGELGLGIGADRADDGGTEMLRPLAEDEADAAGGGVDQDGAALLHATGLA